MHLPSIAHTAGKCLGSTLVATAMTCWMHLVLCLPQVPMRDAVARPGIMWSARYKVMGLAYNLAYQSCSMIALFTAAVISRTSTVTTLLYPDWQLPLASLHQQSPNSNLYTLPEQCGQSRLGCRLQPPGADKVSATIALERCVLNDKSYSGHCTVQCTLKVYQRRNNQ